jgi:hypothetical protein
MSHSRGPVPWDPTPHYAKYDTAPYAHLRVFGCACYPNTSATTPHKLSPRSTRCLFLGYSPDQKGYRFLDLVSHRILIYHHIVFDEDVFPLAGSSPPTDLDSLLESDPIPTPPQIPRATCGFDASARAFTCATRGLDTSTRATRGHVDPALVYHRRGRTTPSAPTDLGPSTSATRFGDPAIVNRRRERAMPSAPNALSARTEPPAYNPVTIH